MAISALDLRTTVGSSRISVSSPRTGIPVLRRVPVTALAAGLVAMLEGVGLLAAALTSLDGVLTSPLRPGDPLVAAGLIVLAGWIVLAAGSGAALVNASGRRIFVGLAVAEIALVGVLSVVAVVAPRVDDLPGALPLPALVLLALALPVGKLLLAGAPAARQWVAQGPRVRGARPDPVAAHRLLAALTLGLIGAGLVALTVLTPVAAGSAGPGGWTPDVVSTP
jgi:hypothetical protein